MKKYEVGILGGGQLARMSMIAAHQLGVSCVSLDPDPHSPAAQVGPALQGSITDPEAIADVMRQCHHVTFENEFIPAQALREACQLAPFNPENVVPGIDTLETIQDKLRQREAYLAAGVPSPRAVPADRAEELGFPCVLKARFGGYDGKGTRYARTRDEYLSILGEIDVQDWLGEEFVPFRRELAVMVCAFDSSVTFPAMITEQTDHMCDLVYPLDNLTTAKRAEEIALLAVKAVKGTGLFGVELFEHEDGSISVNEIAPRPHNTGHYTLDWGGTSQFEAHILLSIGAFTGIQSGQPTCMANLIGQEGAKSYMAGLRAMTKRFPGARMHWYGKEVAKPKRKMGHLNVTGTLNNRDYAVEARACFYDGWVNQ